MCRVREKPAYVSASGNVQSHAKEAREKEGKNSIAVQFSCLDEQKSVKFNETKPHNVVSFLCI